MFHLFQVNRKKVEEDLVNVLEKVSVKLLGWVVFKVHVVFVEKKTRGDARGNALGVSWRYT